MNQKVLVSLMIIGIVGAVAGGGTLAAFGDQETSPDNVFVSGAVDLGIDIIGGPYNGSTLYGQGDNDPVPAFFDIQDVKPGDWYERTLSLHVENNDAYVCMELNATSNAENNITEPEEAAGDTDAGLWNGELAENMGLHIWTDMGDEDPDADDTCEAEPGNNHFDPECGEESLWDAESKVNGGGGIPTEIVQLRLADTTDNVFESSGPMVGEKTYYIGINYSLPKEVGNEIQTDSYTTDIKFTTEQARHNDEFVCDDTPPTPGEEEEPECGPIEGLDSGDTYTATRDNDTGTYGVNYTVDRISDTKVKFEDAEINGSEDNLGEDGEVESDTFEVTINGGKEKVIVTTKAGQEETKTLLDGVGDVQTDGLGFTLELVDIQDNGDGTFTYTIEVTSDDEGGRESPALSHISFEFCKIEYQLDLVGGEPSQDLSEDSYSNGGQVPDDYPRLIRHHHGNSANGLTSPSGNPDQVLSASGGDDCVDADPIQLNSDKTEATVDFTVHNETSCENIKLSFVSYQKPYEGWIPSRADEQVIFDSVTDTYAPGGYSVTVDLP